MVLGCLRYFHALTICNFSLGLGYCLMLVPAHASPGHVSENRAVFASDSEYGNPPPFSSVSTTSIKFVNPQHIQNHTNTSARPNPNNSTRSQSCVATQASTPRAGNGMQHQSGNSQRHPSSFYNLVCFVAHLSINEERYIRTVYMYVLDVIVCIC